MIAYSSDQASARLQMFRMVYGAGVKTTALELSDIHEAMDAYIKGEDKVTQSWSPEDILTDSQPSSGFCKMLLSTLLIAYESLPRGGDIKVAKNGEGEVLIYASGENAQPRQGTEKGLAGDLDLDEMDPRLVHSYVTHIMGNSYGYTVGIKDVKESCVTLSLSASE